MRSPILAAYADFRRVLELYPRREIIFCPHVTPGSIIIDRGAGKGIIVVDMIRKKCYRSSLSIRAIKIDLGQAADQNTEVGMRYGQFSFEEKN